MNFILFMTAWLSISTNPSSLYNIHIGLLGGSDTPLSRYAGKKILIVAIDPGHVDNAQLLRLDSLQRSHTGLVVLAVPCSDFSTPVSDSVLWKIKDSLGLRLQLTQSVQAGKASGEGQHPLFKWLTHVDQNFHFDRDVEQAGQLYFIDEQGTLYGVFTPSVVRQDIVAMLEQHVTDFDNSQN